jgi:hypothetical protein
MSFIHIYVYLAAPYAARDLMRGYRSELAGINIGVTSSWLNDQVEINEGTLGAAPALADGQITKHCTDDFADIDRATALVLFTGEPIRKTLVASGVHLDALGSMHSGGRHVETGYALAKNKHVIVVGEPENVFQRGICTVVPSWHEAVLALIAFINSRPYAVAH